MKLITISLLFIITTFNNLDTNVYICGPTGAKKYHYTNSCRGLNNCRHELKKVSVKQAQDYGLTLCGWED